MQDLSRTRTFNLIVGGILGAVLLGLAIHYHIVVIR